MSLPVVALQITVPFEVPNLVQHPYKQKDPKRDPDSENCPYNII